MWSKLHELDFPTLEVIDIDLTLQSTHESRNNAAETCGGIDLRQQVGDEAVPSEDSESCGIVQALGGFWTEISTSSWIKEDVILTVAPLKRANRQEENIDCFLSLLEIIANLIDIADQACVFADEDKLSGGAQVFAFLHNSVSSLL